MGKKINISISLMADASQFVLDFARAGELKEEHKERFEKIISELLKIFGNEKGIIKECTDIAEIFSKEENMRELEVAYNLWEIGKEAKQSSQTSIIRIMLVLHFYMELKRKRGEKINGKHQRVS